MQPFVGHSRDLLREKNDFIALNGSFDHDRLSGILDYWIGKFFAVIAVRQGIPAFDSSFPIADKVHEAH